jgi:hypothetical protein
LKRLPPTNNPQAAKAVFVELRVVGDASLGTVLR